jgi:hypothetical protein
MSNIYKRPEPFFLLVTLLYGTAFTILAIVSYAFPLAFLRSKILFILSIPAFLVIPLAFCWTIYQCIRYEDHPWKYVLVSLFVPMGFLWYAFKRYRRALRKDSAHTGDDIKPIFVADRSPQKGTNKFLWLMPMIYGCVVVAIFIFTPCVNPNRWPDRRLYYAVMSPPFIFQPLGACWALFQCIRYEGRPWKYIPYLFIPLGFLWYYFERYRHVPNPRSHRTSVS